MAVSNLLEQLEGIALGCVGVTTRALTQTAPALELTFQQWRALVVVGEQAAGVRIGAVAERIGTALPATSRLVRRLERRELVTLGKDPSDGRATLVRLTDAGLRTRTAIIECRATMLRSVLEASQADRGAGDFLARLEAAFRPYV
jgi:DNA-binding MarR family transcriptional regulator